LVVCSLFALIHAQGLPNCTFSVELCSDCSGQCAYCQGVNSTINNAYYACVPPVLCTGSGGTVITSCGSVTPGNLTTSAQFNCASFSSVNGSVTMYAAEDVRIYASTTRVDIFAHYAAFVGGTSPSNPPLLGFQYFAFNGGGNPQVNGSFGVENVDGLGAFWTTLIAVEFIPNTADGSFNPNVSQPINIYNFTQYSVQPCTSNTSGGITTYSIIYTDPNGWIITCRLANAPTKDSNQNPISPVNAKCDLTFGNYVYLRNDTRLGIFSIFVIAGVSTHVSVNPTVRPCGSDTTSYCMVSESSSYAGRFAYVKTLKSGKTVVASGLSVYAAAAGEFSVPGGASSLGGGNNTLTVSSSAFEAASIVIFSFDRPAPGDIWDPTLEMNTKVALDTPATSSMKKSSGSSVTYSLLLIISSLLLFLF